MSIRIAASAHTSRLAHLSIAVCVALVCNNYCDAVSAQESAPAANATQEAPPAPYDETQAADDEAAARKMIGDVRSLILPQQKERAEELIQKYPNTKLAKLAEQLLAEYKLYESLKAAERAKIEARTAEVRAFWTAIYPNAIPPEPVPLSITNLTDEPVLYEVQGPVTEWSGPHNLRPGESHFLKYPATFRRVTQAGLVEYTLRVGQRYVFRQLASGELPQLFRARD